MIAPSNFRSSQENYALQAKGMGYKYAHAQPHYFEKSLKDSIKIIIMQSLTAQLLKHKKHFNFKSKAFISAL